MMGQLLLSLLFFSIIIAGASQDTSSMLTESKGKITLPSENNSMKAGNLTDNSSSLASNVVNQTNNKSGIVGSLNNKSKAKEENAFESFNSSVSYFKGHFFTPLVDGISGIAYMVLTIILVCAIIFWLPPLLRKILFPVPSLTLDEFKDASGDEKSGKKVSGLTQIMDEFILDTGESIKRVIDHHMNIPSPGDASSSEPIFCSDFRQPEIIVPPEGSDAAVKELTKAMSDLASTTNLKFLAPLINLAGQLLPKNGIKISCILQSQGEKSSKLGVTMKVVDVSENVPPRIHTIWEPDVTNQAQQKKSPEFDAKKTALKLQEIGAELQSAGFFLYAAEFYSRALEADRSLEKAMSSFAYCTKKQVEVEEGARCYSNGTKYREEGKLDLALKQFLMPILPEDIEAATIAWNTLFKNNKEDLVQSCVKLSGLYKKVKLYKEAIELMNAAGDAGWLMAQDAISSIRASRAKALANAGKLLLDLSLNFESRRFLDMAIELDPESSIAKDTLSILETDLSKEKGIDERYLSLLDPSSRWLTLEIARTMMLNAALKVDDKGKKSRRIGSIHNFIGVIDLGYALNQSSYYDLNREALRLAISEFEKAIENYGDWYAPYENLGDAYGMKARACQGSQRIESLHRAITEYDRALSRRTSIKSESEREIINNRIEISKAIARLLTGDEKLVDQAKNEIAMIDRDDYICSEVSARLLYNLACWYSLAKDRYDNPEDAIRKARTCLAYSLARDRYKDLWYIAERDSDLKNICAGIERLKFRLDLQRIEMPDLIQATDPTFGNVMKSVFEDAQWDCSEHMETLGFRVSKESMVPASPPKAIAGQ